MSTMNISLPDDMKGFVDQQVASRGYGTSSEYVRDLIRREQDRQHLRGLLLAGAASGRGEPADPAYFDALRDRVRKSVPTPPARAAEGPAIRKGRATRRA